MSADDRYRGKRFYVTGKVGSVERREGLFDESYMVYLDIGRFETVDCELREGERTKATRVKKRSKVKLSCIGRGMVIGSPQLEDCLIQ